MIFMNRRTFLAYCMVLSLIKPINAVVPPAYDWYMYVEDWQHYVDPNVAVGGLLATTGAAVLSALYFWYGKRTTQGDLTKARDVVWGLEREVTTLKKRYDMQERLNQLARNYQVYELTYKEYLDILSSDRSEKDKEQELFTRVTESCKRSSESDYVHEHKKKVCKLLEAVDQLEFGNLEDALTGLLTRQRDFLKEQLVMIAGVIDAIEESLSYVYAYHLQEQICTELEEELTLSRLTVPSQEYTLALDSILRTYSHAVKTVDPYPYRSYMDRIDRYCTKLATYRSFMRKHSSLLDHAKLKNFIESTYTLLRTIQSTVQKDPVYLLQCQLHNIDLENEMRRQEEERRHHELIDLKKKEVALQ